MEPEIPYQNYDILFRSLTGVFQHKALTFYGLDTPAIVRAEKTDLPQIQVKDNRMDFVFLLEDDSYLHLEFQTAAGIAHLERFKLYDAALYAEKRKKIRTAVVYGPDVTEAPTDMDHGSIQYHTDAVYMGQYDGEKLYAELQEKVEQAETLGELDQLNLIFLPLMKSSVSPSQRAIEAVELARKVRDEEQQTFLVGALVAITDKFIDKDYVNHLMEVLEMTRVGELLYKRGIEKGIEQGIIKGIEQGIEQGQHAKAMEIARKMLKKGIEPDFIAETTGLSREEIERVKQELAKQ